MDDAVVGIIVGSAVALIGQMLSYVSHLFRKNREENRKAKEVLTLLRHELESHRSLYQHHLQWARESKEQAGEEHAGYSYQRAGTSVYDQVFLVYWHLLSDDVLQSTIEYYAQVDTFNVLAGSFSTPTPVPIREAEASMERALSSAEELLRLLDKHETC